MQVKKSSKLHSNVQVLIIGAGASGMVAAISAAREGADVTLIEHMDRVGKKILSTGNGKCNYTNEVQGLSCYRGNDPAFVLPAISEFGKNETIEFFYDLGIFPKEKNGYYYPQNEQASSIVDVLSQEMDRLKVKVLTSCELIQTSKEKDSFHIWTSRGEFRADSLIFACGLKALPKSGSDGSALIHIEKFGHSIIPIVPALVQLVLRDDSRKMINGIRMDINVKIRSDHKILCEDRGEVQLTDYGASGIPTFQVSRYASELLQKKRPCFLVFDYLPFLSMEELLQELTVRFHKKDDKTISESLNGLLNKKFIPYIIKKANLSTETKSVSVTRNQIEQLAHILKTQELPITGTKDFTQAQVCAGGVRTSELIPSTMESKLVKHLFFAGEVMDIDAVCGGYNLQWAWSSGFLAGKYAVRNHIKESS